MAAATQKYSGAPGGMAAATLAPFGEKVFSPAAIQKYFGGHGGQSPSVLWLEPALSENQPTHKAQGSAIPPLP